MVHGGAGSPRGTAARDQLEDGHPQLDGAELRYSSDGEPGIWRRRRGRGWSYFDATGKRITAPGERRRLDGLVVPPAWSEVWICADPRGHLQATGLDDRARKQYIYHRGWRELRDQHKYEQLLAFGTALPQIRRRVDRDLGRAGLPREKVVAAVVRLLDRTHIRVGSEEYARENHSFGLTTLRSRHVTLDCSSIRFRFRGKSGVETDLELSDRRVAKVIRGCLDLPGQQLFQYVEPNGERRSVSSDDVNRYLEECADAHFTAKDFRTWAGTVLAMIKLTDVPEGPSLPTQRVIAAAVKLVARLLGNTPAVCRRCYIHPLVLAAHLDGSLSGFLEPPTKSEGAGPSRGLTTAEGALLRLLQAGEGSASHP